MKRTVYIKHPYFNSAARWPSAGMSGCIGVVRTVNKWWAFLLPPLPLRYDTVWRTFSHLILTTTEDLFTEEEADEGGEKRGAGGVRGLGVQSRLTSCAFTIVHASPLAYETPLERRIRLATDMIRFVSLYFREEVKVQFFEFLGPVVIPS